MENYIASLRNLIINLKGNELSIFLRISKGFPFSNNMTSLAYTHEDLDFIFQYFVNIWHLLLI